MSQQKEKVKIKTKTYAVLLWRMAQSKDIGYRIRQAESNFFWIKQISMELRIVQGFRYLLNFKKLDSTRTSYFARFFESF